MTGEQGRSTLPVRVAGRILDKLAGIEKIIPPELIEQALKAAECRNGRACKLTHHITVLVMVAMGLFTHLPIRQVFKRLRSWIKGDYAPGRSALCEARKRLGVEPLRELFKLVVRPLATARTPYAFYHGLRMMGIDSVLMDVPDSDANAEFGRSKNASSAAAFPQVRKVSLIELGTHVEVDFVIGGYKDGESTLARQLWDRIPDEVLLLEDRGFFGFSAWKALTGRVKLLIRISSTLILKKIRTLSDGTYLTKIYPSCYHRDKDRNGIVVRLIEYTLDDPQRTGDKEVHRLLTNLLDEAEHPGLELILTYHERWEHEMVYDEQKTHQDPIRAEKPAQLRSQTPDGVRQELYALSLAHFVMRSVMLEAAKELNIDVDRISFTGTFHILQGRLSECDGSSARRINEWFEALIDEISREVNPPRSNRINPRVIKRKISKWPKKRPHHRGLKPLTKTFEESVVMTS